MFSAPSSLIRDHLKLIHFAVSLPEIPENVNSQIVCSRSQGGVTQWVARNGDNGEVREFLDGIGHQHLQQKPLTLKKLFLFLTSDQLVD